MASWQALATSASPLKSYLAYMNLANADAVLKGELPAERLGIWQNDRTLLISLDKVTPYLPQMLARIWFITSVFIRTKRDCYKWRNLLCDRARK